MGSVIRRDPTQENGCRSAGATRRSGLPHSNNVSRVPFFTFLLFFCLLLSLLYPPPSSFLFLLSPSFSFLSPLPSSSLLFSISFLSSSSFLYSVHFLLQPTSSPLSPFPRPPLSPFLLLLPLLSPPSPTLLPLLFFLLLPPPTPPFPGLSSFPPYESGSRVISLGFPICDDDASAIHHSFHLLRFSLFF